VRTWNLKKIQLRIINVASWHNRNAKALVNIYILLEGRNKPYMFDIYYVDNYSEYGVFNFFNNSSTKTITY